MSHYVYRIFTKNDKLLYIGCSTDPERRLDELKRKMPWMRYADRYTKEPYDTYDDGRSAEARAIEAEQPKYNRFLKKTYTHLSDGKVRKNRRSRADWSGGDYHPSR